MSQMEKNMNSMQTMIDRLKVENDRLRRQRPSLNQPPQSQQQHQTQSTPPRRESVHGRKVRADKAQKMKEMEEEVSKLRGEMKNKDEQLHRMTRTSEHQVTRLKRALKSKNDEVSKVESELNEANLRISKLSEEERGNEGNVNHFEREIQDLKEENQLLQETQVIFSSLELLFLFFFIFYLM